MFRLSIGASSPSSSHGCCNVSRVEYLSEDASRFWNHRVGVQFSNALQSCSFTRAANALRSNAHYWGVECAASTQAALMGTHASPYWLSGMPMCGRDLPMCGRDLNSVSSQVDKVRGASPLHRLQLEKPRNKIPSEVRWPKLIRILIPEPPFLNLSEEVGSVAVNQQCTARIGLQCACVCVKRQGRGV